MLNDVFSLNYDELVEFYEKNKKIGIGKKNSDVLFFIFVILFLYFYKTHITVL
jgi:hypothetical protein